MPVRINLTESMILKPRRVFKCNREHRFMDRTGVWKDHDGRYHCGMCSEEVKDISNTYTGKLMLSFYL